MTCCMISSIKTRRVGSPILSLFLPEANSPISRPLNQRFGAQGRRYAQSYSVVQSPHYSTVHNRRLSGHGTESVDVCSRLQVHPTEDGEGRAPVFLAGRDLSNARQLTEYVSRVVKRIPPVSRTLKYANLFDRDQTEEQYSFAQLTRSHVARFRKKFLWIKESRDQGG